MHVGMNHMHEEHSLFDAKPVIGTGMKEAAELKRHT